MHPTTPKRELLSVGIDIGTSTSHIVFSRLVLEKDPASPTEKYEVTEREVVHEGAVHLTPLIDSQQIDLPRLREVLLNDYRDAGFSIEDIDTGAVIITGETAKRQNAEEIVSAIAGEAGRFVAASAGPNFESLLAAHGSGAVERSREADITVMNIDVGGGSSNIAVCREGRVIDTAAINVGGRLLVVNEDTIVRLEPPMTDIAGALGLSLKPGFSLTGDMRAAISAAMAQSLFRFISGNTTDPLVKLLMMTAPLFRNWDVDEITFSGGVAEYIYGKEKRSFGDLGEDLAREILRRCSNLDAAIAEPKYRIRATVIGAGMSTLRVSGSTTYLSSNLQFPLRNLPVVRPHLPNDWTTVEDVRDAIVAALRRHDLQEGSDPLILSFDSSIRPSYQWLSVFSRGILRALPRTVMARGTILLCFDGDVGNSVGNVMRRETGTQCEILSIDEVQLDEGEFVDIGEPIIEGVVVPIVVKTLVFHDCAR